MNAIKLLWRQFVADPLAMLILGLVSALTAGLAGAIPLISADLSDRQLQATLVSLSAQQGDVAGSWTAMLSAPGLAGLADPWEAFRGPATQISASALPPLRDILGPPQFLARSKEVSFVPTTTQAYYQVTLHPFVDPEQQAHTRLVSGNWPTAGIAGSPIQVAVLAEVATKLGWEIGAQLTGPFVLVGTYSVTDPSDQRWEHIPYETRFSEAVDPNRGIELVAGISMAQPTLGAVTADQPEPVTFTVWFPIDRAGVGSSGTDVAQLRSQLTGFLARRFPIVSEAAQPALSAQEIRLNSDLNAALERVLGQQRIAVALLAVTAMGPLGVGLALILLAARLVIHRRRAALSLLLARGTSRDLLSRWLALEGVTLGLPAAALGLLVAEVLLPGRSAWPSWLAALVVAWLPALALVWSSRAIRDATGRTDLSLAASRGRLLGETLLILFTVAATWQLFTRVGPDEVSFDLLAAVAPILLASTATMLALRFYPYPLRLLSRLLSRSDLPTQLGVLRALREPAGGLLPVATVVLGSTMAVLGAGLLGTLTTGTRDAVWTANGAAIRVSGPIITDELLAKIRATEGVSAAARIHSVGVRRPLMSSTVQTPVELWLAERELLAAYAGSPIKSPLIHEIFGDGAVPSLLVSGDVPGSPGPAQLQGVGDVRVLGRLQGLPGVRTTTAWAVADVAAWTRAVGPPPSANLVLVALTTGSEPSEVAQSLRKLVGAGLVTTAAEQLNSVTTSPVVAGLSRVFLGLAALTGAMLAGILAVAQLMGSAARGRTIVVLRTLGMPLGGARRLTAWELAPALVLALAVGTAAGIGLTQVVLSTLDFGALTGGRGSPPLSLSTGPLGTVFAIIGGGLLLAIAASAAVTARSELATELRKGDLR